MFVPRLRAHGEWQRSIGDGEHRRLSDARADRRALADERLTPGPTVGGANPRVEPCGREVRGHRDAVRSAGERHPAHRRRR